MAARLRKRDATQTLTYEIFDFELDDDDRKRLSADPRGFVYELLQAEGMTVNSLMMESDDKYKTGDATSLEAWHIPSGPAKSGWSIPEVLV